MRSVILSCLLILLTGNAVYAQQKFKIVQLNEDYETNYIADQQGNIIRKVADKFFMPFLPGELGYFQVFQEKGKPEWCAIDIDGNILFNIYNTEIGTPSPDELREGKIRIVDDSGRIGFGNEKGEVVIPPQFEMVSSFYNGKAIIGGKCRKVPWGDHHEDGCEHYSISCQKHGYIDSTGTVVKFGDIDFETIRKEIGWKP